MKEKVWCFERWKGCWSRHFIFKMPRPFGEDKFGLITCLPKTMKKLCHCLMSSLAQVKLSYFIVNEMHVNYNISHVIWTTSRSLSQCALFFIGSNIMRYHNSIYGFHLLWCLDDNIFLICHFGSVQSLETLYKKH